MRVRNDAQSYRKIYMHFSTARCSYPKKKKKKEYTWLQILNFPCVYNLLCVPYIVQGFAVVPMNHVPRCITFLWIFSLVCAIWSVLITCNIFRVIQFRKIDSNGGQNIGRSIYCFFFTRKIWTSQIMRNFRVRFIRRKKHFFSNSQCRCYINLRFELKSKSYVYYLDVWQISCNRLQSHFEHVLRKWIQRDLLQVETSNVKNKWNVKI